VTLAKRARLVGKCLRKGVALKLFLLLLDRYLIPFAMMIGMFMLAVVTLEGLEMYAGMLLFSLSHACFIVSVLMATIVLVWKFPAEFLKAKENDERGSPRCLS